MNSAGMLTAADLIKLPYSEDLTHSGVSYACRSLPYTYDRMGGSAYHRLRRIVAGIAMELALRRHLVELQVPYDVLGVTPFTEPDRYDVALGGRRCDLKSYQIHRKKLIRRLRSRPERLLDAQALVPIDQIGSKRVRNEDIYLFAFLMALTAENHEQVRQAQARQQRILLMHMLPEHWSRPPESASLGALAMKTELSASIEIEVGGQDLQRDFRAERYVLPPGRRLALTSGWRSVRYFSTAQLPQARLGIYSAGLDQTYLVGPQDWGNIWVYGLEIILAGYMTCGEFRRRARPLPEGSSVLQYARTRTDNMALPIAELHPLSDLFERAREWAEQQKSG